MSYDEYPKFLGYTTYDEVNYFEVWEDDPGWYWIDDPNDPGYVTKRPKLDHE